MCLSQLKPGLLNDRTYDARERFGDVFDALLEVRKLAQIDSDSSTHTAESRLSSELLALARMHQEQLNALPHDEQYSRHVIGTKDEWIGFICRWECFVDSCIHGHPSFAYYQVLEGNFTMDLYTSTTEHSVVHTYTKQMYDGDVVWQQGANGCYDNLIHKVSTTDTPGFTLHLFSEDPSRGQHFNLT